MLSPSEIELVPLQGGSDSYELPGDYHLGYFMSMIG